MKPSLRFKEFSDNWLFPPLKEIAVKVSEKNRNFLNKNVLTNSAINGVMKQNEYFDREIVNQNNLSGYYIVKTDDFVYNPRISSTAPVGPVKRNFMEEGVMSPLYTVFRFTNGNLDYLEQFFKTSLWHKYLIDIANVGARHDRMAISVSDFLNMPISLPSEAEQLKISNFLKLVDKKIAQLTKKHELLIQYKKGVMQKLFNLDVRFKNADGKDFPPWESMTLGDVTELKSKRNKDLAELEVYSVTNSDGFVLQSDQFEGRRIAGEDLKSYKIINRGEFAYNPARINVGSIALFQHESGIVSSLYVCFRCKGNLLNTFLYYFLELDKTKQDISSAGEGGVRIYVWYPLFSKININLPCIEEQAKIVSFLSVIDEKISNAQKQLALTTQYKEGLLQQMFV